MTFINTGCKVSLIRLEIRSAGDESVERIFIRYNFPDAKEFLLQEIKRVGNQFQRRVFSEDGRVLINEADTCVYKGEGEIEDCSDES